MARETKVGLLAGLAFIICFAIILANRGRHELNPSRQFGYRAAHDTPSSDWQLPSQPARVQPARNPQQQTSPQYTMVYPQQVVDPAGGQQVPHGDTENVSFAAHSGESASQTGRAPQSPGTSDTTGRTPSGPGSAEMTLISPSPRGPSPQAVLQQRLDELSADIASDKRAAAVRIADAEPKSPSRRVRADRQSRDTIPRPTRYTVEAGDTLSKIAAAHYGRASVRFVNLIFDANRSILSSPDQLGVGMQLVIPAMPQTQASPADRAHDESAPSERRTLPTDAERPQSPIRWYQIKTDDRYVSIAREQLGDGSRWPEIHELNKDKFPDPGRIRPGVRIKLPPRRVADWTERGQ
ncbi:MAG: LysM peptidoglycan-binding domain-containing protein [Phycisphaerales bacterium]|nr:MAG: LysM peptidoglycan-binding domain-containing protein [Phycisphaerales bacterium]